MENQWETGKVRMASPSFVHHYEAKLLLLDRRPWLSGFVILCQFYCALLDILDVKRSVISNTRFKFKYDHLFF